MWASMELLWKVTMVVPGRSFVRGLGCPLYVVDLAPASSGGTVDSAMVDGNEADEQLIRTALGVTLSLQSLDSGSLSGLSISAESG